VRKSISRKRFRGRGLGGGSSDSAAALLGYLRLTRRSWRARDCSKLPRRWARDVPFFLLGGRALGVNKGDEIYPLPDIPKLQILVVSPKEIHVPTPMPTAGWRPGRSR